MTEKLDEVKEHFQEVLEQLTEDRKKALETITEEEQTKISDAQSAHALNLSKMDDEAIQTIESIIEKHKEGIDLSNYIEVLGKSWFNMTWDQTNRIPKEAASEAVIGGSAAPALAGPVAGIPNLPQGPVGYVPGAAAPQLYGPHPQAGGPGNMDLAYAGYELAGAGYGGRGGYDGGY